MKNLMRRSMSLLVALAICISMLPAHHVAAAAQVEYVYDSSNSYIYNWGNRGETATFLSPNAEAFYASEQSYQTMSGYTGGTGTADAPTSELFAELSKLMAKNHIVGTDYETEYGNTRDWYQYTDCQNSGIDTKAISSFYSGVAVGPEWDSGATWNREHTWPNSKGTGGNHIREADIMMLRPTAKVENGSRGNTAYGESVGFYHPNLESNGAVDVRGDVARIVLYVYVRWGGDSVNAAGALDYMWGASGVIESLDILLKWMEEDPVDTWELGRNDSVQSIVGTRNVFVDYPELAFLLFGQEIPSDMITPSGEATGKAGCQHDFAAGEVVAATCTTAGYTVYTCTLCGISYHGDKTPVTEHTYVEGICSGCGKVEPVELVVVDTPAVGTAYKFGMVQPRVSATDVYYLTGVMNGYYMDTHKDQAYATDVYLEKTTNGYYLYTMNNDAKTYINMVVNGNYVNGAFEDTASTVYLYDAVNKTVIAQVNGNYYWFGTRNNAEFTTVGPCDIAQNGFFCQFYGKAGETTVPTCEHTNATAEGAVEPTCSSAGNTGKIFCSDCSTILSWGETIEKLDHDYVDGVCSVCGATAPTSTTVMIYYPAGDLFMTDTASGKKMSGGTREQAAYWNMIANEAGYYSFECNSMYLTSGATGNQLYLSDTFSDCSLWEIFNCSGGIYLRNVGANYNGNYNQYLEYYSGFTTYGFKESDIYVFQLYVVGDENCEHTWVDATCQAPKTCSLCGATEGIAGDHAYENGACTVCGKLDPNAPGRINVSISFSSKDNRTVFTTEQQVWEQNGITVTNDKAASTNDVADYAAPARFYKGSKLTVAYPGMTKIVFNCNSNKTSYATDLATSIGTADGVTVTVEGLVVTVEFAAAQDTLVIEQLAAQVRVDTITVTAISSAASCEHTNTTVEGAVAATCTTEGHTGKTVCSECGAVVSEGSVIPATGHNYENGACTVCGELEIVTNEITIDLTTKDNRTLYSATQQVWEQNGIILTNDQAASSNPVGDYAPIRLYQGSKLTVAYPGMTKIVFNCNNYKSSYADALVKSIGTVDGVTVTVEGLVVTVEFATAQDTLVIEQLTAQVRLDSITVYAASGEEEPSTPVIKEATIDLTTKDNRTLYSATQQVWEQNGIILTNDQAASSNPVGDYAPIRLYQGSKLTVAYPGMTKIVFNCNNYKSSYADALVKSIGTADGVTVTVEGLVVTVEFAAAQDALVIEQLTAQVRLDSITVYAVSSEETPCEHTNTSVEGAVAATCTTEGHTGKTVCSDCGEVISEGSVIPATGHNYENGICTGCGDVLTFTITFVTNGGSDVESQTVSYNGTVVRPADPTRMYHTFGGWYIDAQHKVAFDFDTAVTYDITLYAKWISESVIITPDTGTVTPEPEVNYTEVFTDLDQDIWYYAAVDFMLDNGLMNGVSKTEFAPEANLSRAMMWTILARLSGQDTDTGAVWYENGRKWAMEIGISDGTDPNGEITREQLVVMLWRFMGEPTAHGTLSAYTDANSVSDWAKEAMTWATEIGLVSGTTPTTLDPKSNATRAQVATLVMRFHELTETQIG